MSPFLGQFDHYIYVHFALHSSRRNVKLAIREVGRYARFTEPIRSLSDFRHNLQGASFSNENLSNHSSPTSRKLLTANALHFPQHKYTSILFPLLALSPLS